MTGIGHKRGFCCSRDSLLDPGGGDLGVLKFTGLMYIMTCGLFCIYVNTLIKNCTKNFQKPMLLQLQLVY